MTKVEPMAYMWLMWCLTCATFCGWVLIHYHTTLMDYVAGLVGFFGWIYLGLNPWIPEKKNVE
jgi:hypothetical protein